MRTEYDLDKLQVVSYGPGWTMDEREFILNANTLEIHRAPSGTDARCQVGEIKVKIKITSDDVDAAVKALRLNFCGICWPEKSKR